MRGIVSILFALVSLFPFLSVPTAAQAANCQFVLGFKAVHDLIPSTVGDCKTDEYHNAQNGDGLQETTGANGKGGLLVWRKSDNWTAFTDGYRTWVNGPNGLQQRLNTERFPWENDGQKPGQPSQSAPTQPTISRSQMPADVANYIRFQRQKIATFNLSKEKTVARFIGFNNPNWQSGSVSKLHVQIAINIMVQDGRALNATVPNSNELRELHTLMQKTSFATITLGSQLGESLYSHRISDLMEADKTLQLIEYNLDVALKAMDAIEARYQ